MKKIMFKILFLCCLSSFVHADDQAGQEQRTLTPAQERLIAFKKEWNDVSQKWGCPENQFFSFACERAWLVQHKDRLKDLAKKLLSSFDGVVQHLDELLEMKSVAAIMQHVSVKHLCESFDRLRTERHEFLLEYARTSNDASMPKIFEQEKIQNRACAEIIKILSNPENDVLLTNIALNKEMIAYIKGIVQHFVQKSIQLIDNGMTLANDDVSTSWADLSAIVAQEPRDSEKFARQSCLATLIMMRDWALPVFQELLKGVVYIPVNAVVQISHQLDQMRTTIVPRAIALVEQDAWIAQVPQNVRNDRNLLVGFVLNGVMTGAK